MSVTRVFRLLVVTIAIAVGRSASAEAQPEPPMLKETAATPAVLDVEKDRMTSFRVSVPKDAILMTVRITQCSVVLDLLARKDEPLTSSADAENRTSSDSLETKLLVSRQSTPPLESGIYYVGVTYQGAGPPVVHKRPVKRIPFTIGVSFVRAGVAGVLRPGERMAGQVSADEGSVRTFVVDVPSQAKALRIDLDEVSSDLDILARRGEPILSNDDADCAAMSPLGRESLVIDGGSQVPLKPGRWYINVVHPVDYGIADFAIYASLSPDPPPVLLAIPDLPRSEDRRKREIYATVEVTTENGGASGTMLTEDGLVLTNYHVVAEVAEGAGEKDPVVIGLTMDTRQPTRELFRGKVLAFDKKIDLALVQITCGFYRQPLPKRYRFPSMARRFGSPGDRRSRLDHRFSLGRRIDRAGQRDAHPRRGQRFREDADRDFDQDRRRHRPGQFRWRSG